MHLIKKINEITNDKEMSYDKDEDFIYILNVKIDTAIDSLIIASINVGIVTCSTSPSEAKGPYAPSPSQSFKELTIIISTSKD